MKSAILLLIVIPTLAFSQSSTPKELRKERPVYLNITTGISSSSFRDFGTSPLFYSGSPLLISLSRTRMDSKRESEFGFSYSFGNYYNTFNNNFAVSSVKSVSLYYSQLYQLNKWKSEKFNIKIGGEFNTTTNLRLNESLLNNSTGFEIIPTLFASGKAKLDISRKEEKEKKFLFINYKLKPKTRNLVFRLNVGVLNNSYRNGYAYSGQGAILNKPSLFDDYQFNVFSGFRLNTILDYTVLLKNKNAIQLSYIWDAYKTGGKYDTYEMAFHTFKITLMFNTNDKKALIYEKNI